MVPGPAGWPARNALTWGPVLANGAAGNIQA